MSNSTTTTTTTIRPPPPEGYIVHREASTEILVRDAGAKTVFINPIQEFNRDISIVALTAWAKLVDREKRESFVRRRSKQQANKKQKLDPMQSTSSAAADTTQESERAGATSNSNTLDDYRPYKFTLFEGLSATGLRSLRYANEIESLRWVQANDLSPAAADNIRLNVQWNGFGPANTSAGSAETAPPASAVSGTPTEVEPNGSGPSTAATELNGDSAEAREQSSCNSATRPIKGKGKSKEHELGKVRVSQGDCCSVLYQHRHERERFDAIDLDPYGTAAPFIDGAVQAVNDGGLLCVTCTDLAVLAGSNYPEKCFSNYGGVPVKAEYTHEVALRLLLHTLATCAARYGRHIKPVLSLSIDYYVRVFVRVYTGPLEVKRLASQTAIVYACHNCQNTYVQPLGKVSDKTNAVSGKTHTNYGFASGPPTGMSCEQCNGNFTISGPMWLGPLHDAGFIDDMLDLADAKDAASKYATLARIKGMLTIAKHELPAPFYIIPSKMASFFHVTAPPLWMVASALVNAGHAVSRSHAAPGCIKTDAPGSFVYDIFREWIKEHPVKMENVKENSPTRALLAKKQTHEVDFTRNAQAEVAMLANIKLVRYQQNPTANWGPQARAKGNAGAAAAASDNKGSSSSSQQSGKQGQGSRGQNGAGVAGQKRKLDEHDQVHDGDATSTM